MRWSVRRRAVRPIAVLALVAALVVPGMPATAQETLVLRIGTLQKLDAMNPLQTALTTGYEVFGLNYELLTSFDQNLQPMAGFAERYEVSEDGRTYTFTIPEGKKWSDGEPATSEDARWTFQLMLDSIETESGALCLGYISPEVETNGVTGVTAPDPQTLVIQLERPNVRVLQMYAPILPKHVFGDETVTSICDNPNDVPVVGTGPYQADAYTPGQQVHFSRNPNYVGPKGAADEIVIQFFENAESMVQALESGDLDYAHDVNPAQFDALTGQPDIVTVEGKANGWTQLGFNTYGMGTGKKIENGGPSSEALLDTAFRDALGYAIDKELLVERILGGYGTPGTTHVPPFQELYHVPPSTVRTFDLELAAQKLEAAGYRLEGNARLDKQGRPLVLDLVFPSDSGDSYRQAAEFIKGWWEELGIVVNAQGYESDPLIDKMLPPEAGEGKTADYDLFVWGWSWGPDPNGALEIFKCDQIGVSSDSMYCNPQYDSLFEQQNVASDPEVREPIIAQMQQIIYDEAPYHILFYDSALDAYRTDRFGNWQNQPAENGTPFFQYSSWAYTQLQPAALASPSPSVAPSPGAPSPGVTPAPTAGPAQPAAGTGDTTPLIVGGVALVAVVAVGALMLRRRRAAGEEE